MSEQKILIVEDDRSLSRVLKLKLTKAGYEIDIANNGEEGVKMMKSGGYKLVLLDLIMPKMTGFDVLAFMKKEDFDLPVLILSNLGQNEDKEKTEGFGNVQGYIVKSNISLDDVIKQIDKTLNE
jgi:DNA-binding response OmpR family regulator